MDRASRLTLLLTLFVLDIALFAASGARGEVASFHYQATVTPQYHGAFNSPYEGENSFRKQEETATTYSATLFTGFGLDPGFEIYFDPEVTGGTGLSSSKGIAGFVNGEALRIESPEPVFNVARIYFKSTMALSEAEEDVEPGKNQLGESTAKTRFTIYGGKFSLNDFFDDNKYSHDQRTQFLNWALMDNGAWDFSADTRGYVWGVVGEFVSPDFQARLGLTAEPSTANGPAMDLDLADAHALNLEGEWPYTFLGEEGRARLLLFLNRASMGVYRKAIDQNPAAPDIESTRSYNYKFGAGLNIEQALNDSWGFFSRVGWNDGRTETWTFAEIDRTFSAGLSVKGKNWGRDKDTAGFAVIVNGLSNDHADYLAAGGKGFMLGDGTLNYGPEEIAEIYYQFQWNKFAVAPDVQEVVNPAYNRDRGPVTAYALRLHYED